LIHYAATCIGPGPLKVLLSKGVDGREGDKDKNTPLMLAARFGRHLNIEVLLEQYKE
jgi:ankyrin repeat protein